MPIESLAQETETDSPIIQLKTDVPELTQNTSLEKAENYIYSSGAHSEGTLAKDLQQLIAEAIEIEKSKNGGSPENGNKMINVAIGRARGYMGEIISKSVELDECPTIYGTDTFVPNTEIVDPADFFDHYGLFRKDLALIDYYFEKEAAQLSSGENKPGKLTPENIANLKQDTITTLADYDSVKRRWEKSHPGGQPNRSTLVNYQSRLSGHSLKSPEEIKTAGRMVSGALEMTRHDDTENFRAIVKRWSELPYIATTLPDQFLVDKDLRVVGAVEVKAYRPEEVKSWVENLKKCVSIELETFGAPDEEKDKRAAQAGFYDRRGISINLPDKKSKQNGMRLGVDVTGIRNFINIANKETPNTKLDVSFGLKNNETNVKTVENLKLDYPIIIRLPKDVEDDDILELGSLLEQLRIYNVAIQKLPVTSGELSLKAYELYQKYNSNSYANGSKNGMSGEMVAQLRTRSSWVENKQA